MRLPRDLSGDELAAKLGKLGYRPSRQTGSHLRVTRQASQGATHVTIPRHRALRLGTLNGIVNEVAGQLELRKEELVRLLFG